MRESGTVKILVNAVFFAVQFYFFMVLFRLLGIFYLQCQVRLG